MNAVRTCAPATGSVTDKGVGGVRHLQRRVLTDPSASCAQQSSMRADDRRLDAESDSNATGTQTYCSESNARTDPASSERCATTSTKRTAATTRSASRRP